MNPEDILKYMNAQRAGAIAQHDLDNCKQPSTALIVAVDVHGGFSKDGKIPWNYPSDLKHFKTLTKGHICVMGRATYDSLPLPKKSGGHILPDRKCFVLTSSDLPRSDAIRVKSYNDIFKHFDDADWAKTIFFVGGEQVYTDAISFVDIAYITAVNTDADCDRFVPMDWILKTFELTAQTSCTKEPNIKFLTYTRSRR